MSRFASLQRSTFYGLPRAVLKVDVFKHTVSTDKRMHEGYFGGTALSADYWPTRSRHHFRTGQTLILYIIHPTARAGHILKLLFRSSTEYSSSSVVIIVGTLVERLRGDESVDGGGEKYRRRLDPILPAIACTSSDRFNSRPGAKRLPRAPYPRLIHPLALHILICLIDNNLSIESMMGVSIMWHDVSFAAKRR